MAMDRLSAAAVELVSRPPLSPSLSYLVLALGVVIVMASVMVVKVPRDRSSFRRKLFASAFFLIGLILFFGGIMAGTSDSIFAR